MMGRHLLAVEMAVSTSIPTVRYKYSMVLVRVAIQSSVDHFSTFVSLY